MNPTPDLFSNIGGQSHTVYECKLNPSRAVALDETTPFSDEAFVFMAQVLVDTCIDEQRLINPGREENPCPDGCTLNEIANRMRWYTSGSKGERK